MCIVDKDAWKLNIHGVCVCVCVCVCACVRACVPPSPPPPHTIGGKRVK
jgi:hypothetical protein